MKSRMIFRFNCIEPPKNCFTEANYMYVYRVNNLVEFQVLELLKSTIFFLFLVAGNIKKDYPPQRIPSHLFLHGLGA